MLINQKHTNMNCSQMDSNRNKPYKTKAIETGCSLSVTCIIKGQISNARSYWFRYLHAIFLCCSKGMLTTVKIGLRNKTHLIHKQPSSSAKSVMLTNWTFILGNGYGRESKSVLKNIAHGIIFFSFYLTSIPPFHVKLRNYYKMCNS